MITKERVVTTLFLIGLFIILYYINVFFSIARRGDVTQDYWYCDTYMIDEENDTVSNPHHYGYKPLIPFSDHLCGENELRAARKHNGWIESRK